MLVDAERIEREIDRLRDTQRAKLGAFGFHEPGELDRIQNRIMADLKAPLYSQWTPEQLIAYALERQRQVRGEVS